MQKVYKIKKSLKTPMILGVLISIPVFVDVFQRGYETRILIMASLLVILFYLFTVNNLVKRLTITDSGIIMKMNPSCMTTPQRRRQDCMLYLPRGAFPRRISPSDTG